MPSSSSWLVRPCGWGGGSDFGGSSGDGPTGTQVLRWFIRTGLVILAALIAWIILPFREYWATLQDNPDMGAIIAAALVAALLTLVVTLILDPLNRMLRVVIREHKRS